MNTPLLLRNKILDSAQLTYQLARWRFLGKKIVFTNGCFDILHPGHVDYLAQAADLADYLVVGVNSDRSVNGLKGPGRPISSEDHRAMILAALHMVAAVIIFDEPTPYELIKWVKPEVLVKGSDYKTEEIVGYDLVKAHGGEIRTIDLLPGFSTSAIVDKIKTSK